MMSTSEKIKSRLRAVNAPFNANNNIAAFIEDGEIDLLIEEVGEKFEAVLQSLIIDTTNDPNSHGTAHRLAKMYIREIMSGRYDPAPKNTFFPNTEENRYEGMLVVKSEIRSMCSHHHQPVNGVAYIGIIAAHKLIGLSKYTRIAQWCARRGTLQEELCNNITDEIAKATESENIGVYLKLSHGCCENRGILAHDSTTQTTVLRGAFKTEASARKEFFDNIQIQELTKR
jgi:GTP cyclohydrolase I